MLDAGNGFVGPQAVDVVVVLDRQPGLLGLGQLPAVLPGHGPGAGIPGIEVADGIAAVVVGVGAADGGAAAVGGCGDGQPGQLVLPNSGAVGVGPTFVYVAVAGMGFRSDIPERVISIVPGTDGSAALIGQLVLGEKRILRLRSG